MSSPDLSLRRRAFRRPGAPFFLIALIGAACTDMVGNSYLDSFKPVLKDEAGKRNFTLRMMKSHCALGASPCTAEGILKEAADKGTTHILLHVSPAAMKAGDIRAFARQSEKNLLKSF